MRRVRLILFAVGSLVAQRPVRAQWQLSGDAGYSHLRQSGLSESNTLSFGSTFDASSARAFLRTSLLAARADGGEWTGQGVAFGALIDPSPRVVRWQLSGALSAFSQNGARPTTSEELGASLHTGSPLLGATLGAGAGASVHARDVTPVRRLSVGGWRTIESDRFDIGVDVTRTRLQLFEAPSLGLTYVDASASWRHDVGGVSFGASGGYRAVADGPISTGGWGGGDATVWLTSRAAIVLGVGTSLDDFVRGFPRATYATASMRLVAKPHPPAFRRGASGPRIAVRRDASGALSFEVRAPNANSVELAADFTGWSPVVLTRDSAGDGWRIARDVPPGAHRVMIRIDGGEWRAPSNLPKVDDDLGGSAGVITVP